MAFVANKDKINQLLVAGKVKEAIVLAEEAELLDASNHGATKVHATLMLLYFIDGDAINARFLWKRLPAHERTEELAALWTIGQALWKHEHAQVYAASAAFQWTADVAPLVTQFVEAYRSRTLDLIQKGFVNAPLATVAEMIGLDEAGASAAVEARGWNIEDGSVITPELKESKDQRTSLTQLRQLTEYVVYLEGK